MSINEDWYEFSKKLPLYRCMYLVDQLSPEDLDKAIVELNKLTNKRDGI